MMYSFTKQVNVESLKLEIEASTITVALDKITLLGTDLDVYFKASLTTAEETTLTAVVDAHVYSATSPTAQKVLLDEKKTTSGLTKVSVYEPEGAAATVVTHNFADKCSWYQGSIESLDTAMTTSDNLTYVASGKTHWIDLMSGRLYDEDNVMAAASNKYKPIVKVDGIEVTTGFTIDYEAGSVTFGIAQTGVVTTSFWYASTSYYSLRPKSGKRLSIKAAEVQFCQGVTLPGPFVFAPWFVDHPTYGTMEIPGQSVKYKNFKDFISACNLGQGLIPAIGDVLKDTHVFPFNYARPKPIKHSEYIEIRVYCTNHTPLDYQAGGQFATATFYVIIDDE